VIRQAVNADFAPLARLWAKGWNQAHLAHTPPELTALRTYDDFLRRLHLMGDDLRVVGPAGAPNGFCAIRNDEIYQIYVDNSARGGGIAALLLADGEARITARGYAKAKLDVIIPNSRAQRFYEKNGWRNRGVEVVDLDTSKGLYPLRLYVFVKDLGKNKAALNHG